MTLRDDQAGADDGFRRVFVVETKGVHLKESEDTEYKRSVFDICGEHARNTDWAEFVLAMRSKVVRFEVVDEDEWQARLNGMLFGRRRDRFCKGEHGLAARGYLSGSMRPHAESSFEGK